MGRKSNAPQRRDQITWALYDCLASKGHEKVTIKEIAAQASLPPGVIHYYFKSKDEIISTLAQAIVEKYSQKLEERLSRTADTLKSQATQQVEKTRIAFEKRCNGLQETIEALEEYVEGAETERESMGKTFQQLVHTLMDQKARRK